MNSGRSLAEDFAGSRRTEAGPQNEDGHDLVVQSVDGRLAPEISRFYCLIKMAISFIYFIKLQDRPVGRGFLLLGRQNLFFSSIIKL